MRAPGPAGALTLLGFLAGAVAIMTVGVVGTDRSLVLAIGLVVLGFLALVLLQVQRWIAALRRQLDLQQQRLERARGDAHRAHRRIEGKLDRLEATRSQDREELVRYLDATRFRLERHVLREGSGEPNPSAIASHDEP